jgi:acetolactate synthase-1/2/3 large subunit
LTTLEQLGVEVSFGVPGGTISGVFDALARVEGIRHISTRNECAAGFAAMGYARATGRPALILTTSGPGLTNALTAVASASYEQLPMIVVGGEVARSIQGRGAIQDGSSSGAAMDAMFSPICNWTGSLAGPNAAGIAAKAWAASMGPVPGPVMVRAALDIGNAPAPALEILPRVTRPQAADLDSCHDAVALLRAARRPLLVLGNGARRAHTQLLSLAERLGMCTVVTGHGKGAFPERHPLYVGIIGLGQHAAVLEYLANPPDVTLIVGSRLNDLATNGWSLPLSGTTGTIQIDRDPTFVGANATVTLALIGDARATVEQMLEHLPEHPPEHRAAPAVRLVSRPKPKAKLKPPSPTGSSLQPAELLMELQRQLPDTRFVADIGEHLAHALYTLRVDHPDQFTTMLGYGSMGSGVCSAIGMKLAVPDESVVCICGDGGFSSYIAELMTCVEAKLGVVFVVFNDGRWNMVEHGFEAVYGSCPVPLIKTVAELGAIANHMGAVGHTVRTLAELQALDLGACARGSTPVVIDARIDPSSSLTRETRSAALEHFTARR